jgi:DNA-binding GntR family transcriptional regulator
MPTYLRLRELLRSEIERGEYEDKCLPTDQDLTQRFGVSRFTVRQALSGLRDEGLIRRVPGRGTFATGAHNAKYVRALGSVRDILAIAADTALEVIVPLHEEHDEEIGRRLGLTDDCVAAMVVMRFRHGHPLGISHVHLPPWIAEVIEPPSTTVAHHTTIIERVEKAIRIPLASADQDISAVAASRELAQHLDVATGDPLLRIERLYHGEDGLPVELSISHLRPDRYTYHIVLRGTTGW